MQTLYLLTVYVHLLAVMTWMGGMLFLVVVLVPWLRRGDRRQAVAVLRETGERFRLVGWLCFAVLLLTGSTLLWLRGVRLDTIFEPGFRASDFGRLAYYKVGTFSVILAVSAWHDFKVGPAATRALDAAPDGAEARRLRGLASQLGRLNLLLGLGMVLIGVQLVRGAFG